MGGRLQRFIQRLPFSPSDWLVVALFGLIAIGALLWLLSTISLQFTVEVPARGGEYHEGIVGTPRFINPVLAISDADRDLTALVFSGLLRAEPNGTLNPDVADGYTVSEDKKTYTFTIRDGAEFQDGTPITADDVAFTIALAQDPAIKSPKRANWEGVAVSVIDPKTISFTLKDPYAPFLNNTTLGILPKHLWQSVGAEEFPFAALNIRPVGEGPFKLESLTQSPAGIPSEISLAGWSGARHTPFIAHMVFSFYNDAAALVTAAKNDPNLAVHSVSPTDVTDRATHEAVLSRVFGVFFNQNQNDLFADKVVRTALNAALDKKALVSTLIGGYGSVVAGPLPPESAEVAEVATTTKSATEILEAAGWVKGADGFFVKKTPKKADRRLAFTLVTGNAPELKAAAEAVSASWRAIGVDVSVQFFEQSDLQQDVIRPRKYDALLFGEVVGRDLDLFAFWHSSQRNDPGLNIAMYANITADKELVEARGIEDIALRRQKEEEVAQMIQDEVAAVFLYAPHFIYLAPTTVSGITLGTITTPSDRFMNVTNWYVKTERVWPVFAQ